MTNEHILRLIELLTRAKAVWFYPELLNLARKEGSPSKAYKQVFKLTGKRRKALAARWYALAIRDFNPDLVDACVSWLKFSGPIPHNLNLLTGFLINALGDDKHSSR